MYLVRCGADAQSDQETVEMLTRLELLTERLSRRQPDTPSSSLRYAQPLYLHTVKIDPVSIDTSTVATVALWPCPAA